MKVTLLGHATLLLEIDGIKILTNPWLSQRSGKYLVHKTPPAMLAEDLPKIHLVLATTGHASHFDPETLEQLDKGITVVTPKGQPEELARSLGFENVWGLEAGELMEHKSLSIEATAARVPEAGGIGFLICGKKQNVFYVGTTARDERLLRLGDRHTIDLALIPIDGNRYPDIARAELAPAEAAELSRALQAHTTIPVAYDQAIAPRFDEERDPFTVDFTAQLFKQEMERLHPKGKVVLLGAGESWKS